MRPTGRMHLGHYHGALRNWVRLQDEYPCLYFVADWHALTTHYETPELIADSVWDMVVDWLAAGVDPSRATLFIQSRVPEHAELTLLLGMMTPVGWLERVPTYKDQQEKLKDRDLATYGFLGYPVMQGADILIYRANLVPVGEDQVSHLELVRELARRFNFLYGREPGFEDKARAAVKKLGSKKAKQYEALRTAFQERGDDEALAAAKDLLEATQNLSHGDRERLFGYLEGSRRVILPEPQPLLTATPKVPGARRPEDVEELRQRDPDARGARRDHAQGPHDADRPGARAPHRSGRPGAAARCGRCTRSIRRRTRATGWSRAARRPASAASTASSR